MTVCERAVGWVRSRLEAPQLRDFGSGNWGGQRTARGRSVYTGDSRDPPMLEGLEKDGGFLITLESERLVL